MLFILIKLLHTNPQHSENQDHGIQSHHFIANRWGNNESDRLFGGGGGGSKITADGDYRHEIKRHLFLGIKAMTNLDSIKKQTLFCQQRSA